MIRISKAILLSLLLSFTVGAFIKVNRNVRAAGNSLAAYQAPAAPVIAKAFGDPTIPVDGTTSLTVTITNPNAGAALTGVAFTDTLPAGLAFATPSGLAQTCGGVAVAATGPPTTLSLSAGALAAGASCTVSVNVTGSTAGTYVNSVQVTSTNGGTGNTTTATLLILAPPTIAKTFGTPTIPVGGTTSLTVTITNPNGATALTGVAFTDTLPAGLAFATPSGLAQTCGGVAVAATGPPASLSLSGGTLAAGASCTVSANVTGSTAGTYINVTGAVTSTNGGTGNTATATVVILAPPTISKAFGAPNIALGGTTSLTVTITNPNPATALTGVAFTDSLPAGLAFASPSGLTSTCGGVTVAATGPPATLSLSGGALAAGASCTIGANVTGTLPGVQVNTTSNVTSTNGGTGNTATSTVAVGAPPLGVTIVDPFGCTGPGDVLTVTVTLSNPTPLARIVSFVSSLPAGLVGVPGSGTSTVDGPPTVTGTSAIFGPTSLAAGQTVTVTYQVQVGDVPAGTALTISTQPTFGGVTTAAVTASTTVNCPGVGPGLPFPSTSEMSDQKAGSVLIYNFYTSGSSPTAQNTRINITNTHQNRTIAVHLFFVDGTSCSVSDANICLTANQTSSFLTSDLDPGTTGYIVAIATDTVTGCPVNFNFLIGDEYVKMATGHAANLGAEAFSAIAGGLPACNTNSVTAQLNFDGISYNRAPRVLAADNVPSRADGNDTLLVVNRVGGNLAIGASTLGTLFGVIYDDSESPLSFSLTGSCQLRGSLSGTFPRTAPRFEQFIPAGRSGWLKLFSQSDIGIVGAVLNTNPNSGTAAGAFGQGHNLHVLTLTSAASLTIPIFPPGC